MFIQNYILHFYAHYKYEVIHIKNFMYYILLNFLEILTILIREET